jgi:WD40 repeat protein
MTSSLFRLCVLILVTTLLSCGQTRASDAKVLRGEKKSSVRTVCFSPDGNTLVASHADDVLTFWDVPTGKLNDTLRPPGFLGPAAFFPDGKTLAVSGGQYRNREHYAFIRLLDMPGARERAVIPWTTGTFAISSDGKTVAAGDGLSYKVVKLWDVATGEDRGTLEGHRDRIDALAFASDGKVLASASFVEDTVILWDVNKQQEWTRIRGDRQYGLAMALSPDGKQIAIGGYPTRARPPGNDRQGSEVKVFDVSPRKAWIPLTVRALRVEALQFSPDGKRLAVAADDFYVQLYDLQTRELWAAYKLPSGRRDPFPPRHLAFSPDGSLLAIACGPNIHLWPMPKDKQKVVFEREP